MNRISLDDSQTQQQQQEYSGRDDDDGDDVTNKTINEQNSNTLDEEKDRALEKRKFVLLELIDTERDYVQHLGMIVDGYIQMFRNTDNDTMIQIPDDLKGGKYKIVFGNLENIYEWHKE